MLRRTKLIIASGAAGVVALAGGGIAVAAGTAQVDDSDREITGDAFDRASEAALAETGGGRVTATEVGDEEGYYEVEVTLDDGTEIDVHLDESFNVVGSERDAPDGPDDDADESDDANEVED